MIAAVIAVISPTSEFENVMPLDLQCLRACAVHEDG